MGLRALTRLAALLVGLGVALTWLSAGLHEAPADALDGSVALPLTALGWLLWGWLALGGLLCAGSAANGIVGTASRLLLRRLLPGALRRGLAAALGITVLVIPSGAFAVSNPGPQAAISAPVAAGGPSLPVRSALDRPSRTAGGTAASGEGIPAAIDRPAATWTPHASAPSPVAPSVVVPTPRPELAVSQEIAVRPGDTLWGIAARHLGSDATAESIASEWPRWWQHNRSVIGENPHLLHPGDLLTAPPGRTS